MPISLAEGHQKLHIRIRTVDRAFDRHVLLAIRRRRTDRFAFQEGLISTLWQIWNSFCRSTLIASSSGTISASGVPISSPYTGLSEPQIRSVLKQLCSNRTPNVGQLLAGIYQEPTWGDLGKFNLMAVSLNATNSSQLASAFSCGLVLRDLQLCRNACAHLNRDNIRQIQNARVRYSETKFSHPSDMMLWEDPASKDYVWKTWIEEIEVISQLAVH